MPTYEYVCTDCGERIEVFQRISDPRLEVCGVCGGALRKVFHPVGIAFKGSGFYTTDNRPKRDGDSEKKSDSGGEKKPEGKPSAAKEKTA